MAQERTLDRIPHFDERSKDHRLAAPATRATYRLWHLDERNDQGQDGACVGFGTGHRLAAAPIEVSGVDYAFSMKLYNEAKTRDPWPGEDYDGTAVLAGIKTAQAWGYVTSYKWCFTLQDYISAILTEGPVLVGVNWLDSMFDPNPRTHVLDCSGSVAGGHCFILRGVNTHTRMFRMTNSWGPDWGYHGDASISFADWEKLMADQGEGAVLYEKRL
jgi:hypothetical protein